jgi:hypothetical protein
MQVVVVRRKVQRRAPALPTPLPIDSFKTPGF